MNHLLCDASLAVGREICFAQFCYPLPHRCGLLESRLRTFQLGGNLTSKCLDGPQLSFNLFLLTLQNVEVLESLHQAGHLGTERRSPLSQMILRLTQLFVPQQP